MARPMLQVTVERKERRSEKPEVKRRKFARQKHFARKGTVDFVGCA